MAQIHARAAIQPLSNLHWRRARRRSTSARPYLLSLVALCIASAVTAISDPLLFAEIFSTL